MSVATAWGDSVGARIAGIPLSNGAYRVSVLSFALLFGILLSQIPNEHFKDFENYLIYAEYSWERLLDFLSIGIVSALVNEPFWLLINAALGAFLPAETVVRTIIFISASSVAWLLLTHNPRHFLLIIIFLLLPSVLKNWLVHLRQGAAIALFLWGWYSPGSVRRWLRMGMAAAVHTSFIFVLIAFAFTKAMRYLRIAPDIRAIVFVIFGISLGIGMGWAAMMLGARQAEQYAFTVTDVSGLAFFFWCGIAGLWLLEGRAFLRAHSFEFGIILIYLSTYWLVEVTARIFESGLLPVLLAGLALTKWRRVLFVVLILTLGSLMWVKGIGQPGMGFAIG